MTVHVRAIGRCVNFDDTDAQWKRWRFRFETWIALLNLARRVDELLTTAVNSAALMVNETMVEKEKNSASAVLYAALVENVARTSTDSGEAGCTLARVLSSGDSWCWNTRETPDQGGMATLVAVLSPRWTG